MYSYQVIDALLSVGSDIRWFVLHVPLKLSDVHGRFNSSNQRIALLLQVRLHDGTVQSSEGDFGCLGWNHRLWVAISVINNN